MSNSEWPSDKKTETAVFLDRDGTLIEEHGVLRRPEQAVFFPDTVSALRRLQRRASLFIVTHQPCIAQGQATEAEVRAVNNAVVARLAADGVSIERVYCCPHAREEGCECIKPKPYFLEQAAREFGLDPARCFMVGDHPADVRFAENAGGTGILVRTGHGEKHRHELAANTLVVPGIREAADWIEAALDMQALLDKDPNALIAAADCLRSGGIVAFPTETVYGLGAVLFNETALARVFEAKNRPRFDPLIVHIADRESLANLVESVPDTAQTLAERFWPGPLTLVLPKKAAVPDLATAGLPTVAVRMPSHPLALDLIRRVGIPLAAPSANAFGHVSPTTAQHVRDGLGARVDRILDGGPCAVGVESTIVSFATGTPTLLRPGGLPAEAIEALIGPLTSPAATTAGQALPAPGMLPRHYAPRTPLSLTDTVQPAAMPADQRVGLLAFRPPADPAAFAMIEILSETGDLREAAARLFGALRRLDAAGLDRIEAEPVPDIALGRAINDRLRRASKR